RVDDRRILNGIFWVLRSGAPWRDLPSAFGPYTTCYNRFVRWRRAGVWGRIIAALAAAHDAAVQMIDTTSSPPPTSRSSSLRRYAYGCALMSPRPSATLADFSRGRDSQITFSVTHGWSAFWRGRPWFAERRIGETSLAVGSSRFWIGWVTRHGDKCARSTCRD